MKNKADKPPKSPKGNLLSRAKVPTVTFLAGVAFALGAGELSGRDTEPSAKTPPIEQMLNQGHYRPVFNVKIKGVEAVDSSVLGKFSPVNGQQETKINDTWEEASLITAFDEDGNARFMLTSVNPTGSKQTETPAVIELTDGTEGTIDYVDFDGQQFKSISAFLKGINLTAVELAAYQSAFNDCLANLPEKPIS